MFLIEMKCESVVNWLKGTSMFDVMVGSRLIFWIFLVTWCEWDCESNVRFELIWHESYHILLLFCVDHLSFAISVRSMVFSISWSFRFFPCFLRSVVSWYPMFLIGIGDCVLWITIGSWFSESLIFDTSYWGSWVQVGTFKLV